MQHPVLYMCDRFEYRCACGAVRRCCRDATCRRPHLPIEVEACGVCTLTDGEPVCTKEAFRRAISAPVEEG